MSDQKHPLEMKLCYGLLTRVRTSPSHSRRSCGSRSSPSKPGHLRSGSAPRPSSNLSASAKSSIFNAKSNNFSTKSYIFNTKSKNFAIKFIILLFWPNSAASAKLNIFDIKSNIFSTKIQKLPHKIQTLQYKSKSLPQSAVPLWIIPPVRVRPAKFMDFKYKVPVFNTKSLSLIQNSSFLIQISSLSIQNSSFLIHNHQFYSLAPPSYFPRHNSCLFNRMIKQTRGKSHIFIAFRLQSLELCPEFCRIVGQLPPAQILPRRHRCLLR